MKKTIKYNLNYVKHKQFMENLHSKLCKKACVFFAFGKNQFDEKLNKYNLQKDDILSIGYGGYIPKTRKAIYLKGDKLYDELQASYIESLHKNKHNKKYLKEAVKYELGNYEYGYTMDSNTLLSVYYMLKFNKHKENSKLFFQVSHGDRLRGTLSKYSERMGLFCVILFPES